MIVLLWLCAVLLEGRALAQADPDPCVSHQVLNDSTMLTDYNQTSNCNRQINLGNWTRFVSTTSGLIATTCPSGNQCGCNQQIWIDDPIPNCTAGIRNVTVYQVRNGRCRDLENVIQVKMCNGFMVFNSSLPGVICFANDSVTVPELNSCPATTTASSTTDLTTHKTTTIAATREITTQNTSRETTNQNTTTIATTRETTTQNTSRETTMQVSQRETIANENAEEIMCIKEDTHRSTFTYEGIILGFVIGVLSTFIVYIAVYLYRKRWKVHSNISASDIDIMVQSDVRSDTVAKPKFFMER